MKDVGVRLPLGASLTTVGRVDGFFLTQEGRIGMTLADGSDRHAAVIFFDTPVRGEFLQLQFGRTGFACVPLSDVEVDVQAEGMSGVGYQDLKAGLLLVTESGLAVVAKAWEGYLQDLMIVGLIDRLVRPISQPSFVALTRWKLIGRRAGDIVFEVSGRAEDNDAVGA